MNAKDMFKAFGGILMSVAVALTIAAIASSTGEIKTQLTSYSNGKGFFEDNNDLYALVLVPSAKESSITSIATSGARKRLQAAVETLLPGGKYLIRTAASQGTRTQTTVTPQKWETATVEIFFAKNSTTAASGILIGAETLKEAKELAAELSSKAKGLPGAIRAVRLTAASCETAQRLYPAQFRLWQSMPVVGGLFSTLHEQSFLVRPDKENDKRVRVGTLSVKERYKCTITKTGYRGRT
jgi:hypothetical protein